jgi:hypothetical protein
MPRTHGHAVIPFSRTRPSSRRTGRCRAPGHVRPRGSAASASIIAALVEDGATLQMGIGAIPDAVLARLGNKHDLGVHTEMFSDGLMPLIEAGWSPTGTRRCTRAAASRAFVTGSRRLYDFVDDNLHGRVPPLRPHQRHGAHRQERQGRRHQLGARGRPHRAGVRGLHRPPDLLGHRRPDGLHPRRGALEGRQAHHRAARPRRRAERSRASRRRSSPAPASSPAAATCTGSSPSTARSTCTARRCASHAARARRAPDLHRAPGLPRRAAGGPRSSATPSRNSPPSRSTPGCVSPTRTISRRAVVD